jgi:hypothetical protein
LFVNNAGVRLRTEVMVGPKKVCVLVNSAGVRFLTDVTVAE